MTQGRGRYGGWRFIPKQGYRSPKVFTVINNDPTGSADAQSASSSSSPVDSPITDSAATPVSRRNGKKRKESGKSSSSSHEGWARAKTAKSAKSNKITKF